MICAIEVPNLAASFCVQVESVKVNVQLVSLQSSLLFQNCLKRFKGPVYSKSTRTIWKIVQFL